MLNNLTNTVRGDPLHHVEAPGLVTETETAKTIDHRSITVEAAVGVHEETDHHTMAVRQAEKSSWRVYHWTWLKKTLATTSLTAQSQSIEVSIVQLDEPKCLLKYHWNSG